MITTFEKPSAADLSVFGRFTGLRKGGRSWKVAAQVPVRNCARGARRPAEKEGASGDAAAHTGLSWKVELETE